MGSDFYLPGISPKFKVKRDSATFALGSCFAQEVQQALLARSIDVKSWIYDQESMEYLMQKVGSEYHYWPAHFFHRYNIPSMVQEIGNIIGHEDYRIGESLIQDDAGQFIDLHYHYHFPMNSFDGAMRRRDFVRQRHSAIKSCDLFIITLGLTETWLDTVTGRYANAGVPHHIAAREPGRYEFLVLDYQECYDGLKRAIELLKSVNEDIKILVTVSPIPLDTTFTSDDVVVATMRSKSTLVTAAHHVVNQYESVDYFPSYEIVSNSGRSHAWREDQRHPQTDFVQKIMDLFISSYFED